MPTQPDFAARLAHAGQLLVRSGIEIDRILAAIAKEGTAVNATLPSKQVLVSRLLSVNPVQQRMYLSCPDVQSNRALLAEKSIVLKCNHQGTYYAFSGRSPRLSVHGKDPAIQLGVPTQVVARGARFTPRPSRVPPVQAPIECELRIGVLSFGARLVDVSLDGRGFLVHDDAVPLCAGTRVTAARIRHPQHEPIEVDLEIAHVTPVVLPEGKPATRIGCRIITSPSRLEELIRLFVIDLL